MQNKKFIQVFEYQKLRYDDSGDFRKHHFDAMVKFNERHQNKYFTIIHQGIRFGSYVGVIQIGGLTIEILPKKQPKRVVFKKTTPKERHFHPFIYLCTENQAKET